MSNALSAFNYITKIGKFSWFQKLTIKYMGAFVMTLVAKKIQKREQIDDPKAFLKRMAEEWANGLSGKPYMGGEAPSASDISVFGITRPVSELEAGKILESNATFRAWVGRMKALISSRVALST